VNAKLSKAGKDALRRATAAVEGRADAELLTDTVERYAWAVHTAAGLRKEWLDEGQPNTLTQTNGVTGEHPLLRAMQAAERHAGQMAQAVGLDVRSEKGRPGRPVGAQSAPDRKARQKLRVVS